MATEKLKAFLGSINSISAVDGIAPIIGPKNGIILVTRSEEHTSRVIGVIPIFI